MYAFGLWLLQTVKETHRMNPSVTVLANKVTVGKQRCDFHCNVQNAVTGKKYFYCGWLGTCIKLMTAQLFIRIHTNQRKICIVCTEKTYNNFISDEGQTNPIVAKCVLDTKLF